MDVDFKDVAYKVVEILDISHEYYEKIPSLWHFFIALGIGIVAFGVLTDFWSWLLIALAIAWRVAPVVFTTKSGFGCRPTNSSDVVTDAPSTEPVDSQPKVDPVLDDKTVEEHTDKKSKRGPSVRGGGRDR